MVLDIDIDGILFPAQDTVRGRVVLAQHAI